MPNDHFSSRAFEDRKTLFDIAHLRRLTHALQDILKDTYGIALPEVICCRVVNAGYALRMRKTSEANYYLVRPWPTMSALGVLAGKGYLFDPRIAFAAISQLEERHIVDRRRMNPTFRQPVPRTEADRTKRAATSVRRSFRKGGIKAFGVAPRAFDGADAVRFSRPAFKTVTSSRTSRIS